VDKVLIDTSTFFDIWNAPKHLNSIWAQNTLARFLQYQAAHPRLTVSSFTVFEHLDGLYRQKRQVEAAEFLAKIVPTLEVIYPDLKINDPVLQQPLAWLQANVFTDGLLLLLENWEGQHLSESLPYPRISAEGARRLSCQRSEAPGTNSAERLR